MHKKKAFFITFEGIEGSGKSFQSKILYNNLKKKKFPVLLTREPGGTLGAEKIRNLILKDYFHKNKKAQFDKYTDTLLYLAARNEHIINKITPALSKKKIIICDRFVDSTFAYQVYGKKVNKKLIDTIHSFILNNAKPDLTFILKVNINKAMKRINKRKTKNRYDEFSVQFYKNVQNAFIKIAKKNKKKYIVLDNSSDTNEIEKIILNKFYSKF
jgi:dTMP kinase